MASGDKRQHSIDLLFSVGDLFVLIRVTSWIVNFMADVAIHETTRTKHEIS
jgi:hypothetical protein